MLAKDKKKEGYCYCCFLNKNIVFRIKMLLLSDFCGHKQTLTLLFLLFAATFTAKLMSVRPSVLPSVPECFSYLEDFHRFLEKKCWFFELLLMIMMMTMFGAGGQLSFSTLWFGYWY